MLKCEICCVQPQTPLLTRCCKLFICETCRQKYEKTGLCICGKNVNKKLCTTNPELFQIIKNYYEGRPQQCDRCDKFADIQCFDCNMVYCNQCNTDVHNGKGFAKHIRDNIQKQGRSHKKIIQKSKRKEQWCLEHKLVYENVCQCGTFLCQGCLKGHKESCIKLNKTKTMKQYKEQFFSQILLKIKKITQYKEFLQSNKKDYLEHFNKQKQTFTTYQKLMQQQLQGLKKIFDMKITQIRTRLADYWKECLDAHSKNQYIIQYNLKKFDDYGRLSQKFVQKVVGLDYLQKKVKRITINQQFFNFKLQGVDEVQHAILNMNSVFKNWQINNQDNILLNFDATQQKNGKQRKLEQNYNNSATNTYLLLQCSQNPKRNRPLTLKSSHNQILFQFLHLPHQSQSYQIEYGVGLKMKGQQIFKKIQNRNGIGIINNLNPATKYRIRMRVAGGGQWGLITEIKTQQAPKFLTQVSANSKHTQEAPLQILKTGTIFGSNQIYFGIHSWEVKIFPPKHTDQQTACISIGLVNKEQKKPIFVGTTLNYGYQKTLIVVKITLNCDENKMIISSSTSNQDQIYQNLPNFPIFPAIQNKGSSPVQIQCTFN